MDALEIVMGQGFVEVIVRRRGRGRPSRRRVFTVQLRDGTRLSIGDRVPSDVIQAVMVAVLGKRTQRC
jgi:hypothetical protein